VRKLAFVLAFACGIPSWSAVPNKDFPSWVKEVASRTTPAYSGRVPAAVLLQEQHVTVEPSGAMNIVTRKAVKILNREGLREADAVEYYFRNGRQVKSLRAWSLSPSGFEKTFDKASVADQGDFGGMELYNDIRFRRINPGNLEIGSVFAYESEVEEQALFAQDEYDFQDHLPFVESRYVLTLPSGWTASAVTLNYDPIDPLIDGSTYTWTLKSLPFRERESYAPSMRGLSPRLAVDFRPGPNVTPLNSAVFRSWSDVSRWHTTLAASQDEVTPGISSKAAQLTANAKTELEKIRAIGAYVQQVRYVAIEMDLAHGGGYKPHAAQAVFQKQYGDCKDKANLMRAMLKATGIQSYLVAIFSGDRTYVKDAWPSPAQFNHMILAVQISAATTAPSVIDSPAGRLLIFDPTNDTTPVGDLPYYEQSSFALICAGDKGGIARMPAFKADANTLDVAVEATLTAEGNLTASVASSAHGTPADIERARHANTKPDEYGDRHQRLLNIRAKRAVIDKLEVQDSLDQNLVKLKIGFKSSGYAQLMQGRMLIFEPSVVSPGAPELAQAEKRSAPIVLNARHYRKQVRIAIPPGFTIDELPESTQEKSDFASFSLTFEQEPGYVTLQEELVTEAVTLPADQYPAIKKFFDKFAGADQQRAVLIKN
jgi:hypothetical protein